MAIHMRNGIQYGGIPNGTVKGVNPSTVPTTVKQLNQIGTVGNIAPVTIPSAVKFSNGNTLETAIGSVATIETSPTVATHEVGEFIFYNGQMYKVIAAIAVGETLTVGTNISATTVGSELTALNNGLIVPLMSNTEFHAVNRTIAQGSYYECPVDGFYSWAVYGGNNATAMLFLDSDNNITKAFYASDTSNANHIVSFPFKAGTKVYARSSFGNYVVKGYWAI